MARTRTTRLWVGTEDAEALTGSVGTGGVAVHATLARFAVIAGKGCITGALSQAGGGLVIRTIGSGAV